MRDAAAVLIAPGPFVRALFLRRGLGMPMRTTFRKTTLLLLKPELVALALAMVGFATRMSMLLLAAEGGGGPIPALVANRVLGEVLMVRNTTVAILVP